MLVKQPSKRSRTYGALELLQRPATFTVAAYDASKASKEAADYICDGTADQVQIQAAIDALPSSGGSIALSEGAFTLTATVTINRSNVIVKGQGHATKVQAAAGSEALDLFDCGDGITQRDWLAFSDLCLSSVNQKTAGAALTFNKCFGVWCRNVYLEKQYRGIWVLNTHQFTLVASDLRDFKEHGVVVETAYRAAVEWHFIDVWMDNPNVVNTGAGIWWLGGEGLYVQSVTIQRCNIGFLVAPANDTECRWGFIDQLLCDTNLDCGIKVTNAGAPYGDVHGITFTNCWAGTNPHFGFLVEKPGASEVTSIRLIGCKSMHNGWAGIRIAGGKDNSIDNCDVFSNGDAEAGVHDGISIGDGIGEFSIRGCRSGNGADHGATQRYGICVGLGAADYYLILGNDCRNNVTGGILDLGEGANKVVEHNLA